MPPQNPPAPKSAPAIRLKYRLLLALSCGMLAGAIAFATLPTTFSSQGIVHFRPNSIPTSAGPTISPMVEPFIQTQMAIIRSRRCVERALASPRWLDAGHRKNSEAAAESFYNHLSITHGVGNFIYIAFSAPDPKTATDGVSSIIDAYQSFAADLDPEQPGRKQAKLKQLKSDYEVKITNSLSKIQKLANPYTPEGLRVYYAAKMEQVTQAQAQWKLSLQTLDNWRATHPDPATGTAASAPTADVAKTQFLEEQARQCEIAFNDASKEAIALANKIEIIDREAADQTQAVTWLNETKQNMEELRIMQNATPSLEVVSTGEPPIANPRAKLPLSAAIAAIALLLTFLTASLLPRRK